MIKLNVERVKGYTATGYVSVCDLPDDIIKKLKIDPKTTETVDFEAEFYTYASEDDAQIEGFDGLYLIGTPTGETYKGPTGQYETSVCETSGITIRKQIWGQLPKTHDVSIEDDSRFDIDDLCEQIVDQSDTYRWYTDRLETEADYYYDAMREGD